MADGRHLGKSKNRHISAAFWPISTKFGRVTHFDPLEPSDCYKFEILKIQDGGGRHLEKSKNRHISAAVWPISTQFDIVTVSPPWTFRPLKFQKFKNSTWRPPPSWKNRKIAISRPRFDRFQPNLTRRRISTLSSCPTVKNLKFWKFKVEAAEILENRKIAISR